MKIVVLFLLLFFVQTSYAQDGHRDEIYLPSHRTADPIYEHAGYTLQYSEEHEQALWVAYELTAHEVAGSFARTDNFRRDPSIETGSAALTDYKGSGYDRGHLAPAADMRWSRDAMSESFYLSNISPQEAGFNRGVWKRLESRVRALASKYDKIYVVTGAVLTEGRTTTIGVNGITVPDYYYKVLLDPNTDYAVGYLMPHESSKKPLSSFAVPVDVIEGMTGLDFFPRLDDTVEERIESTVSTVYWAAPSVSSVSRAAPAIESERAPQIPVESGVQVYATKAGKKYHGAGCRYLSKSKIPMTLANAKKRYDACKVCRPAR